MQSKQKITLYIPPELHRKLKIKAAVDFESMSALVERAIAFYMQFPEQVDEIRALAQGKTHQIHICPDCDSPMVMRDGEMVSLSVSGRTTVEKGSIPLDVANQGSSSEKPNEEELVSCL